MDSANKSKMLHSMINKAKDGGEVKGGVATDATMNRKTPRPQTPLKLPDYVVAISRICGSAARHRRIGHIIGAVHTSAACLNRSNQIPRRRHFLPLAKSWRLIFSSVGDW